LSARGVTIRAGRTEQSVKCPAHEDKTPSLSIGQGRTGAVLYCQAGCSTDAVLAALGLKPADLFDAPAQSVPVEVKRYEYTDSAGKRLFDQVRYQPKDFRLRLPGRDSGGIGDTPRVLFRLPEVIKAVAEDRWVLVTEGEQDADRLRELGFVSTTSPMGAGKWHLCDTAVLSGAKVAALPDNDAAGHRHAADIAGDLDGRAAVLKVIELDEPDKGDVSDWLSNGGTADQLRSLIAAAPEWTPALAEFDPATAPPIADALAAVDEQLDRFMHFEFVEQRHAVVLWVAGTYVFDAYDVTPYLHIKSPEKRSGKTLLLDLLYLLCRSPLPVANMSPAALYRVVEKRRPTLLLDEVDAVFPKGRNSDPAKEEFRGLLNAGYRKGFVVYRSNPKGDLLEFSPFCPKALAGIGDLPDTVADRSIPIALQRKPRDVSVARFRLRKVKPRCEEVALTVAHALAGKNDEIARMDPHLPDELNDREQDTWELLFAIADLAGGHWPELARNAALKVSREAQDASETIGEHLLADLRDVWGADEPAIPTKVLLERLIALEEAPWSHWFGREIDARFLAQTLKRYGVTSKKVKYGGQSLKGYRWEHLAPVWDRYVSTDAVPLVELGEPREPSLQGKGSEVPHQGEPVGNPAEGSPKVPHGFPTESPTAAREVPQVPQVPQGVQERVTDRESTNAAMRDLLTRSGTAKEAARGLWDATCEDLGVPNNEPLTQDELAEIRRLLDFEETM